MTAAPRPLHRVLADAEDRLVAAGCPEARLDARLLAAAALGLDRLSLLLDRDRLVDAAGQAALAALIDRRAAREPVSRILGRREFWSLDFTLAPDTLDPRADTETLVEAVLDQIPAAERARPRRLADFGTGSGCVLLALLSELPGAWGVGIDLSPGAAAQAAANARHLGLDRRAAFLVGDWDGALAGERGASGGGTAGFDILVSNPPYIPDADIAGLAPEVRGHDPWRALAGGDDGLGPYRLLAPAFVRLLVPGGLAAVEHGLGQRADVAALLAAAGLDIIDLRDDLAGLDRVVVARRPG